MAVVAIDSSEVVKKLKAAGFTEAQAEAVFCALNYAQGPRYLGVAMKADLALGLAQARVELLKCMVVGAFVVQALAIFDVVLAQAR